ncbi:hypothetical protein M8J76_005603 [Diaphorina citri]|jgi:Type IV secretory pathway, TrbL components|nr:hypothetical protein M8J75_012413 [Diaphorina citri]KAI5726620.1 hypothetical protein M8J76_005603 [Diaphorina citri]KAI5731403.1 hypothetical protein M8J77_009449 [Diaphorina citri]
MVKGESERTAKEHASVDKNLSTHGTAQSNVPNDHNPRSPHSSDPIRHDERNATNDRNRNHLGKRGTAGSGFGSLSAGYNNGYSLGSGYSSGLLLPTGSGLGTRYSSGLGYQTSGYGPVLGVGSGLGIASGLNSINAMGMAPVGLTPSTVITSGPGLGYANGVLSSPTLSYSSSGYHQAQPYPSSYFSDSHYPSSSLNSYSGGGSQYPYSKSYESHKPVIITKEVPVHITKEVPVHVPQPYPVTVTKDVPYPVPQPYAVPVPKPYAVHVPQPVPVHVDKPYPVKVDRPVLYPYPQPVPYPVTKHVPYPVVKTLHVPYPVKTVMVPLKSDYQYSQGGGGLYSANNYNTDDTHSTYGNGPYTYALGVQGK